MIGNQEVQVIRNYNDANKLIQMGNPVLMIDRNKFDRTKLIFVFEKTKKIIEDLRNLN